MRLNRDISLGDMIQAVLLCSAMLGMYIHWHDTIELHTITLADHKERIVRLEQRDESMQQTQQELRLLQAQQTVMLDRQQKWLENIQARSH